MSSDTEEDLRLQVLRRYDIFDIAPEETFDRLTRIVAAVLRVPIAAVTFVDDHRQWFKSRIGAGDEPAMELSDVIPTG